MTKETLVQEARMSSEVPMVALESGIKEQLLGVAATIRGLSIDAVQAANSGHPGLPLGCAELGAYLYGYQMRHNPNNSGWLNRDRFVLSAGHGSAWLYSCLHLAGFDLSLDELKRFRQLHSETPGHPESLDTDGVETTTGPLGQGLATAAGQALGLKLLAARFNEPAHELFTAKVYCLAGDGCMMEGISSETSSLAGHLRLDNLVVIYDSNQICLDGPLSECCSENTSERYRAYGWEVYEVDGHDLDAIHSVFQKLDSQQTAPALIVARTTIGKGSPNKAGTHKVHGAPLGDEEVALTKEALGLPNEAFFVSDEVRRFFTEKLKNDQALENEWCRTLEGWKDSHPEKWAQFHQMKDGVTPQNIEEQLSAIEIKAPIAGRKASSAVIQKLASLLPQLVGGSADLSCSDATMIKDGGIVAPGDFTGRNIKYGVREFAMAAMASGLSQTDMLLPFVGTFFTFSDYMRNAVRLAALMKQKVIYQFTHDSVFLGEDGPTHQPIEHLASLRAMPNLHVVRPGDEREVKMAWLAALRYDGPTAIVLSRQNLPSTPGTDCSFEEGVGRGAYIIHDSGAPLDFTLVATGSELSLAHGVVEALEQRGKKVRLVSMPCWELFDAQDAAYRDSIFGGEIGCRVAIEAGVSMGWHKYVGVDGVTICMETFGLSAPQNDLAVEFGFTVEAILHRLGV